VGRGGSPDLLEPSEGLTTDDRVKGQREIMPVFRL
jgi:hypothetical protein